MLALRPNCEGCDRDLPPDGTEAMICSYECTYCRSCVDKILANVCPNCGGGFCPRPIRPTKAYRPGVSLGHQPASETRVLSRYSKAEMQEFAQSLKRIPPQQR
ncbi:DUF1272 domain-containing protein [Bowmanella dokdonensis]|uniref:DUF1272 domain-containing protein n=1 Tax=Bowmanella dokdonensis TaxID=751969 RepID=A0A939DLH5_9ALTE|nr:DUF1272 domain-containing protein [Bowmanella dokdonensis]MBN7824046.1 DUF1272 domain-containing protein [Bowmanella dokdonensis]